MYLENIDHVLQDCTVSEKSRIDIMIVDIVGTTIVILMVMAQKLSLLLNGFFDIKQ